MGRTAANMGIAVGDADGDGLFDVFVTHLTDETPTLWRSVQPGLFDDATASAGLNRARWRGTGFGTVMADFDCDGALDIVAVNGKVKRGQTAADDARVDPTLGAFWRIYAERDQLFQNTGAGQFEDISDRNEALCGVSRVSRGVAYGDLDNDGRLDLVVTTVAGEARVFRNVAARRGHWLLLRLIEPTLHRDAYGAEVTVIAEKRRWRRWVNPGSSYLSSSDPRVHVGLGPADHFDGILVVWPDGRRSDFREARPTASSCCAVVRAGRRPVSSRGTRGGRIRDAATAARPCADRRAAPAAAGAWLGLHRTRARELPELRRDGIDSAVARAIEEASAAVRGNPESGAAWGQLGMVLQAHDLLTESCACFDEASRWDPREARWPYFRGPGA
jgi:hypothetical protein